MLVDHVQSDEDFRHDGEAFYAASILDQRYLTGSNFVDLLSRSAHLGDEYGHVDYGQWLLGKGNKREAFISLAKAAEKGNDEAIILLKSKFNYHFEVTDESLPSVSAAEVKAPVKSTQTVQSTNSQIRKESSDVNNTGQGNIDPKSKIYIATHTDENLGSVTATDAVSSNLAETMPLKNKPYFVRYVSASSLNERTAPNGNIVNRQYRGQLLRIYGAEGKWYRVSPKSASPRYVHSDYLDETKPKPIPVKKSFIFSDSRIERSALPTSAGQYGLNKYDVETIWLAARKALDDGICRRIYDADKSISKSGKYYLNCGGSRNKFFRRNRDSVYFD